MNARIARLVQDVRVARRRRAAVNDLARLILPLCNAQCRSTHEERFVAIAKAVADYGQTVDLECDAAARQLADLAVELNWDGS